MLGRTFAGRYKVESSLGVGPFGTAYKARHLKHDREVVLQVLRPEISQGTGVRAQFRSTMRAVSLLAHANILRVTDHGEEDGLLYTAGEYYRARALDTILLADGPMDPRRAAGIAADLAHALGAAHEGGVIHGGLTARAVLLCEEDAQSPRVVRARDFGLAALMSGVVSIDQGTDAVDPALRDLIAGMGPELARGKARDRRSDLYALGAVLYHMVRGRSLASEGCRALDADGRGLSLREEDLDLQGLDPDVADLLYGLLAASPEERIQTADEAAEALTAYEAGLPLSSRPTPRNVGPLTRAVRYSLEGAGRENRQTLPAVNLQRLREAASPGLFDATPVGFAALPDLPLPAQTANGPGEAAGAHPISGPSDDTTGVRVQSRYTRRAGWFDVGGADPKLAPTSTPVGGRGPGPVAAGPRAGAPIAPARTVPDTAVDASAPTEEVRAAVAGAVDPVLDANAPTEEVKVAVAGAVDPVLDANAPTEEVRAAPSPERLFPRPPTAEQARVAAAETHEVPTATATQGRPRVDAHAITREVPSPRQRGADNALDASAPTRPVAERVAAGDEAQPGADALVDTGARRGKRKRRGATQSVDARPVDLARPFVTGEMESVRLPAASEPQAGWAGQSRPAPSPASPSAAERRPDGAATAASGPTDRKDPAAFAVAAVPQDPARRPAAQVAAPETIRQPPPVVTGHGPRGHAGMKSRPIKVQTGAEAAALADQWQQDGPAHVATGPIVVKTGAEAAELAKKLGAGAEGGHADRTPVVVQTGAEAARIVAKWTGRGSQGAARPTPVVAHEGAVAPARTQIAEDPTVSQRVTSPQPRRPRRARLHEDDQLEVGAVGSDAAVGGPESPVSPQPSSPAEAADLVGMWLGQREAAPAEPSREVERPQTMSDTAPDRRGPGPSASPAQGSRTQDGGTVKADTLAGHVVSGGDVGPAVTPPGVAGARRRKYRTGEQSPPSRPLRATVPRFEERVAAGDPSEDAGSTPSPKDDGTPSVTSTGRRRRRGRSTGYPVDFAATSERLAVAVAVPDAQDLTAEIAAVVDGAHSPGPQPTRAATATPERGLPAQRAEGRPDLSRRVEPAAREYEATVPSQRVSRDQAVQPTAASELATREVPAAASSSPPRLAERRRARGAESREDEDSAPFGTVYPSESSPVEEPSALPWSERSDSVRAPTGRSQLITNTPRRSLVRDAPARGFGPVLSVPVVRAEDPPAPSVLPARNHPSGVTVTESGAWLPWRDSSATAPVDVSGSLVQDEDEPVSEPSRSMDEILAVDQFFESERKRDQESARAPQEAPATTTHGVPQSPTAEEGDGFWASNSGAWVIKIMGVLLIFGVAVYISIAADLPDPPARPAPGAAQATAHKAPPPGAGVASAAAPTAEPTSDEEPAEPAGVAAASTSDADEGADDDVPPGEGKGPVAGAQAPADSPDGPPAGDEEDQGSADDAGPADALGDLPSEMVLVEAGGHLVGCGITHDRCVRDAMPQHRVSLKAFGISRREVTVSEYMDCVRAGKCDKPGMGKGCNAKGKAMGDHPINCVTFSEAQAWCAHKGWRLPTEQEWEAAARGRRHVVYPWGSQWPTCVHGHIRSLDGDGCGTGKTRPAGTHAGDVSWVRALDMGGNVREWVDSDFAAYARGRLETVADPGAKVVRGGSFQTDARSLPAVYSRGWAAVDARLVDLGFRCAISQ